MWGATKKEEPAHSCAGFLQSVRLVKTHARTNKQAYLIVAPVTPACVAECGGSQKTYLIAKR